MIPPQVWQAVLRDAAIPGAAPAPRSLSEDTNLALGKYARVASAETTVHGFAPQKMSPSASSLAAEKFSSWICW